MVKKCIVCKSEQMASESRSFHKFPSDGALKMQWMYATSLSSITKSSLICSDHFDDCSFSNRGGLYGCPFRRRLLKNAVPTNKISQSPNVLTDVSDNSNLSTCSNHNVTRLSNGSDNENESKLYNVSDMEKNIERTNDPNLLTEKNISDNDNELCVTTRNTSDRGKSKLYPIDNRQPKKIRFISGFQTEYFSRHDCVSDESWERFLRFNKYKNRLLKSAHNKNTEKSRAIRNIKGLVKEFQQEAINFCDTILAGSSSARAKNNKQNKGDKGK